MRYVAKAAAGYWGSLKEQEKSNAQEPAVVEKIYLTQTRERLNSSLSIAFL